LGAVAERLQHPTRDEPHAADRERGDPGGAEGRGGARGRAQPRGGRRDRDPLSGGLKQLRGRRERPRELRVLALLRMSADLLAEVPIELIEGEALVGVLIGGAGEGVEEVTGEEAAVVRLALQVTAARLLRELVPRRRAEGRPRPLP